MKICLEKDICSNLNVSLRKEWLEANQLGSYACSTIYGLNYRKYHGLFIISGKGQSDHQLLLSKFDESVFIDSQVYELSANRFVGGIHPDGYKYLQRFCVNPFPTFTYLIDGRRLEKVMFMLHDQNTLIIRYTNKNQGPPLKLILKPVLASRDISGLTRETAKINTDSYYDDKVVKITPSPDVPELKIYYLKGDYTQAPLWYYNFQYTNLVDDNQTGNGDEKEDLFNTGFFTCKLDTYESLDLYVSVDELYNFDYDSIFRKEKEYRRTFRSRLKKSSIFIKEVSKSIETLRMSNQKNNALIFPDHPISNINTRNTILSLFGYMLVEKNNNQVKDALLQLISRVDNGLLTNNMIAGQSKKSPVDNSLLLIYFMLHYYRTTRDVQLLEEHIFEVTRQIVDQLSDKNEENIYRDKDGLLFSGTNEYDAGWIPASAVSPNLPRYGKLLEINALYYSALKTAEFFSRELKKNRPGKKYAEMAQITRKSFLKSFWDDSAIQFSDVIRENFRDNSFRINQLFLISLPFSVLDETLGHNVLKQVENELLTPYGLRSLSFKDKNYIGKLSRIISHRDPEYYRGTVWPWTLRMYVTAVLKYRGNNQQVIDYLRRVLENFEHVFHYDTIGYLPELFEGNPPHRRNGSLGCSLTMCEYLLANFYLGSKDTE
jgi:predicted glycogen debranching enzyme